MLFAHLCCNITRHFTRWENFGLLPTFCSPWSYASVFSRKRRSTRSDLLLPVPSSSSRWMWQQGSWCCYKLLAIASRDLGVKVRAVEVNVL
jgi:hypothetical protein